MRRHDDPQYAIREVRKMAQCDGKQRLSRDMATKLVLKSKRSGVAKYQCRFCGHWHLGNDGIRK